jgi:uncharacterized protein YcfJ
MKKSITVSLTVIALLFASGCQTAGPNERRGAQLGALAGAVIGAVIGNQSGEAGAGAAVGALAGAAVGAVAGNDKDQKENRRYERGTVSAQPVKDQYGYTFEDYMGVMTDDEVAILQSRADLRPEVPMGTLLTDQERANLRKRRSASQTIGS